MKTLIKNFPGEASMSSEFNQVNLCKCVCITLDKVANQSLVNKDDLLIFFKQKMMKYFVK